MLHVLSRYLSFDFGHWQYRLDALRFRWHRTAYYHWLSAMMESLKGRDTLADIFTRDARRYGNRTVRGRLSAVWSKQYPVVGGDLALMWAGCFPEHELDVLRIAQRSGSQALIHSLGALANTLQLIRQARQVFWGAMWSAGLALLLLLSMVMAVPLFTVPTLQQVFASIPPGYYGSLTLALFGLAEAVRTWWLLVLAAVAGLFVFVVWSMGSLTGPVRRRLDGFWLWRFYRAVNSLRFMAVLLLAMQRHDGMSVQLRPALALLQQGCSRWLRWHVHEMLMRIDRGIIGSATFDTGLLERELFWYFDDMETAHGLVAAMSLLKERIAHTVLPAVRRQAAVARWVLLLLCLAGLLGLLVWHYGVIDELRRSLMLFYST